MLNAAQERECNKTISCDKCMKMLLIIGVVNWNVENMNFVKNVNGLKIS